MRRFAIAAAACLVALAACEPTSDVANPPPASSSPSVARPSSSVSTTPVSPPSWPASPRRRHGATTSACVDGWVTPPRSSPRYSSPLGVIRRTTDVRGPLIVTDMRYFTGPESPPSDKGYLLVVERWYVRLYARRDPAFQARFLVEARRFGQGLSAVAPYDTRGFRSPDWVGFQYDSADTAAKVYAGLPGAWSGTPYDFVRGGEGLTFPGLPAEVAGCLDGT